MSGVRHPSPARRALRIVALGLRPPLFLLAAGLAAFALVAGSARLLQMRGATLWGFPFAGFDETERYGLAFAVVPLPILAALVVWRARRRYGRDWTRALGFVAPRPGAALPLALLLWPVLQLAWISLLAILSGRSPASAFQLPYWLHGGSLAVWLAWLVVLAPAAEELVFRGDLFARARGVLGAGATVALSAGLFALSHGWASLAQPLGVLPLGLALGLVRVRTGSLWACMALHAVNNAALVLVMFARS